MPCKNKLDASNLFFAYFTWFRAFEDRTVLTYEQETTTVINKLLATRCRLDLNYSGRDRHPPATYAIQVACQTWNNSHVRGHVRLVRAASSHYATKIKIHKGINNMIINAHIHS